MEPAFAVSPLYNLIPRYCGFESRPLLVEPPLFLWATAKLLKNLSQHTRAPYCIKPNGLIQPFDLTKNPLPLHSIAADTIFIVSAKPPNTRAAIHWSLCHRLEKHLIHGPIE
jgi:hypothetical protein